MFLDYVYAEFVPDANTIRLRSGFFAVLEENHV